MSRKIEKNVPGWFPTEKDYCLYFKEVNDLWIEVSNNLPKYNGITLADYLSEMNIVIPDFCQFCRIINEGFHFEYRAYGGFVRIDVEIKD